MSQKQIVGWQRSEAESKLKPRCYEAAAKNSLQFSIAEPGVTCVMESTSTQQTYSPHPMVQAQEPDWEVQRLQEAPQEEEQEHHHHHHHPQKGREAAIPTDQRLKEESEEEHLVA